MAKINILDSTIYNKIAAGEVVERPASVIKEFLDNSLDAGADDIKIDIKGGGLKSITVRDNGCGIEKEYLKTAFLPHATSKISSENDLYGIKTLGFRGEALASVAAVSMVNIKTMTENSLTGSELTIKGGVITEEGICGMGRGTSICCENLFFNTPARLKFLKSERAEESETANIISRYILANPEIRIKFTSNGKIIYQSNGGGLKEALNSIYGKEILNNITEINYADGNFKLNGYIGKPSYSKPNRTYQTLAINGRYILNTTVSAAITNAYGDFLMKRQYPFYTLHLTVPADFIDVNVHPNKLDVRFEDNKKVFHLFYQPVYEILHNTMQNIVLYNHDGNSDKIIKTDTYNTAQNTQNTYVNEIIKKYDNPQNDTDLNTLNVRDIYNSEIENKYLYKETKKDTENRIVNDFHSAENFHVPENNSAENAAAENAAAAKQCSFENLCYDIKCVLFNTFIVIESGDDIYLIDQHAAHERLLYDSFCNKNNSKSAPVQDLLIPFLVNVNPDEYDYLYGSIKPLNDIGFNLEIFGGNVFKVSSVPAVFSGIDLNAFFEDLLRDLNNLKNLSSKDILKEALIKKACHAAVKAGDVLNKTEIDNILKKLFTGAVLLCPHGRPVVIKYSKTELEKQFKRIV